MEEEKIIKRYISQRCIGYSPDFTRSYYESVVEYRDGTRETVKEICNSDTGTVIYRTEMTPKVEQI